LSTRIRQAGRLDTRPILAACASGALVGLRRTSPAVPLALPIVRQSACGNSGPLSA
jgi:hypothetical protein